ncbi:MAG TPA: HAD family hydrolase [Mycobacteriales bacterium]|nr:HAD family hydrolase [Mycobacteriales bacterium]
MSDVTVDFSDSRLRTVWSLLCRESVDVLTVDVFDTLLWRAVPEPTDAFLIIGERLRAGGLLPAELTPAGFSRLRIAAEQRARKIAAAERDTVECTLAEIYAVLAHAFPAEADLEQIMEVEIVAEADICQVDRGVAELIRLVDAKLGKRAVLVSDTYFSAEHITRLLAGAGGDDLPLERIFTSSDMGLNKPGGLLKRVASTIKVDPERIVHMGDNEAADVEGSRRAGAHPVHYERLTEELTEIVGGEARLHGVPAFDIEHGDFGLTAMRARVAHRLEIGDLPAALRPYWQSGATVFGPSFTGFAEWAVGRAQDLGVDRMYCLMREGDFLGELLGQAADWMGAKVKPEVIWASRHVVSTASLVNADRESLEKLLVRRNQPTPRSLAAQLGFSLDQLPELGDIADTKLFSGELVERVFDAIEGNGTVRAQIMEHATTTRERLLAYLDQHIPADADRIVVVDIGWGGTIQRMLSEVLQAAGRKVDVVGLYFVTNETAVEQRLRGLQIEGYLADTGEPAGLLASVVRSPEIVEQICMPDAGSLLGFTENLEPITSTERMSRTQVAQTSALREGILAFMRQWQREAHAAGLAGALSHPIARGLLLRMVSRFVGRPTNEEAIRFGVWSHDENFGSDAQEALVGEAIHAAVKHMSPLTLSEVSMADLYWPAGVAAVADPAMALEVALAAEGELDAELASPAIGTGDLEIYIDDGQGFRPDLCAVVTPRGNHSGLSLVRARLHVSQLYAVRIDLGRNRGLVRVDWLSFRVDHAGGAQPVVRKFTDLRSEPTLEIAGAALLQSNLVEVTSDDPQLIWRLDPTADAQAFGRASQIDVELAFAWMDLRYEPIVPAALPLPSTLPARARRLAGKGKRALQQRL